MPYLPNIDAAHIELPKIAAYLLNDAHSVGGPKSAFFKSFGVSIDQPEVLEAALLEHARQYVALPVPASTHGLKFEICGPLSCPDGRLPHVKAIWIIDAGKTAPRLVTACPA